MLSLILYLLFTSPELNSRVRRLNDRHCRRQLFSSLPSCYSSEHTEDKKLGQIQSVSCRKASLPFLYLSLLQIWSLQPIESSRDVSYMIRLRVYPINTTLLLSSQNRRAYSPHPSNIVGAWWHETFHKSDNSRGHQKTGNNSPSQSVAIKRHQYISFTATETEARMIK